MIAGQRQSRRESSKSAIKSPTNLRVNGRLYQKSCVTSDSVLAAPKRSPILSRRPHTASKFPKQYFCEFRARDKKFTQRPFFSSKLSDCSSTKVSSSNNDMAPMTVPLLPVVDKRPSSLQRFTARSLRSPSPRKMINYATGKNALLQDTIHILRPNNTVVKLQKVEMDRRGLTNWPSHTGSESPRMLSLQYNLLTRIEPPVPLQSLVFLDLYHNHIRHLSGLKAMPNLKILLLAKNRLSRLNGLDSVNKLEVLDLHGNQLHNLSGLSHLKELRLLNLAGNMLRHVNGLKGLDSLTELNLRRNQIRFVDDLHLLPKLEKLYLSYNEIYRFDDISIIQKCHKLREICLKENPITKQPLYFNHAILKYFRLKKLDDFEITSESRKQAEKGIQKAKEKEVAKAAKITDEESRNSAINSARKNWKTLKDAQFMIIRKPKRKETEESLGTKGDNCEAKIVEEVNLNKLENGHIDPSKKNGTSKINTISSKQEAKFELTRSKSYFDLKQSQLSVENFKSGRPKSSVNLKPRFAFKGNFKEVKKDIHKNNQHSKVINRTSSDSSLQIIIDPERAIIESELTETSNDMSLTSRPPSRILRKAESSLSLRCLPDGILATAVTRVQSNLHRLQSSVEAKYLHEKNSNKFKVSDQPITPSESGDEESDTSSDSCSSLSQCSDAPNDQRSNRIEKSIKTYHNIAKQKAEYSNQDKSVNGLVREQGPNFLAELDGKVLRLYGNCAIKCTELSWDKTAAGNITTAHFQYINFDDVAEKFSRLRLKFPRLEHFLFLETGIDKCSQLNALAELHQISSINISSDGNPVTKKSHWDKYATFRLAHWGLNDINGKELEEDARQESMSLFSPVSVLAYSCLPRQQLSVLTASRSLTGTAFRDVEWSDKVEHDETRVDKNLTNQPNIQELIGKEALQYRSHSKLSMDELSSLVEASRVTTQLVNWTLTSIRRLHQLEDIWPSVLHDLTRDAFTDVIKPNYGKVCLESLKRDLGWKK